MSGASCGLNVIILIPFPTSLIFVIYDIFSDITVDIFISPDFLLPSIYGSYDHSYKYKAKYHNEGYKEAHIEVKSHRRGNETLVTSGREIITTGRISQVIKCTFSITCKSQVLDTACKTFASWHFQSVEFKCSCEFVKTTVSKRD